MPGPNPLASDFLETCRARVDAELDRCITRDSASGRLQEAMRYSVLGGGKRIRPALCLAAAKALGQTGDEALIPACAVERIHAYSLIHDDLPAMDDDELRRGRPTTHIAFDEATAILAGDALQALAFGWLAEAPGLPEAMRLIKDREFAPASGHRRRVPGHAPAHETARQTPARTHRTTLPTHQPTPPHRPCPHPAPTPRHPTRVQHPNR